MGTKCGGPNSKPHQKWAPCFLPVWPFRVGDFGLVRVLFDLCMLGLHLVGKCCNQFSVCRLVSGPVVEIVQISSYISKTQGKTAQPVTSSRDFDSILRIQKRVGIVKVPIVRTAPVKVPMIGGEVSSSGLLPTRRAQSIPGTQ